jgi:hypothetical protein
LALEVVVFQGRKIILNFFKKIFRRLRLYWRRRYYYLADFFAVDVPAHPVSWTPDGFIVHNIADTHIRVVDNFCTEEEVSGFSAIARKLIDSSGTDVLSQDVESTGIYAVAGKQNDPAVLSFLHRCAILFGVPHTHCSRIVLAACRAGTKNNILNQQRPANSNGRQHTAMLFLNTINGESGAETVFADMNLALSPRAGRVVCWTHDENQKQNILLPQEVAPVGDECKWVLQFWFTDEPVALAAHDYQPVPQANKGEPLSGSELTPAGVWAPQDIDLEAVFGQPDKLKGLV